MVNYYFGATCLLFLIFWTCFLVWDSLFNMFELHSFKFIMWKNKIYFSFIMKFNSTSYSPPPPFYHSKKEFGYKWTGKGYSCIPSLSTIFQLSVFFSLEENRAPGKNLKLTCHQVTFKLFFNGWTGKKKQSEYSKKKYIAKKCFLKI